MRSAWFVVVAVALMLSLPSFVQANDDEVKPVSDSARLQQLVNELNAQRVRLDAQAAEIEILRSNASVQPSLSLDGTSIPAEMDPTGPAQAKPALPEDVKSKWGMNIYGFVEADFISDNRQLGGLVDAAGNPALPRGESYASQHGQLTFGARNSRIGLNANAPEFAGIRASGKLEMDFLGINGGTTATAANLVRIRRPTPPGTIPRSASGTCT